MISVIFSMCSLIYILIVLVAYFSKRKIETAENKNYGALLICNFSGLALDILGYYALMFMSTTNPINIAISKLYLCYYFLWTYLFMNYILITSRNANKNRWLNYLPSLDTFLAVILMVPLIFLPLNIYQNGTIFYSSGLATSYLILLVSGMVIISVVTFIKNYKKVAFNKKIPLIIFFVGALIVTAIQIIEPTLLLITFAETIVTVLMYFTIENPDVKMLEEFKIAKNRAEKANEEKELFLYNITQDIRMPLYDIKNASNWIDDNIKEIDKSDIHDGMTYIGNKANNVIDIVNSVLDISNIELVNIKVYNTKYNIKTVVEHLKKTYANFSNEDVKLTFNVDSNIPQLLYGDALRIRQLVQILIDNSIKYTDKGMIEVRVNTIVKRGLCRLIISVEDTGCGIKSSEIDKIFNKDNKLYNSLDKIDDSKKNLAIAKSITSLLGGVLLLDSEIDKGTKITLVLDQKIYEEKSKELNKLEEDSLKYIGKKEVMLVIEDKEYMDKVYKKLSRYDIHIEKIDVGSKCLDRIRLNHKYDLIIMDEELKYLSSLEILNKLKKINNFNTPICLLTNNIENDSLIKEGFAYLLDKKVNKKDTDKIIEKI